MAIKWRPHRGALDEAMREAREITNLADLKTILSEGDLATYRDLDSVRVEPYGHGEAKCPDERIGWDDTWVVTLAYKGEGGRFVVGFTDGPVT